MKGSTSTVTAAIPAARQRAESGAARLATAAEVSLVYAGILFYIWQGQFIFPKGWMLLWGIVIASHIVRRDSLRAMGLTQSGLRSCAQIILPLAAAIYVPVFAYGLLTRRMIPEVSFYRALASLGGYGLWCVFQQYLTQSYFHRRLAEVIHAPLLRSALVGLMFAGAHIPSSVLMVATFVAGFVFAEVFRRAPNIWPLALAQFAGGLLIAALTPASLIHGMRVGPGYFFYGIH